MEPAFILFYYSIHVVLTLHTFENCAHFYIYKFAPRAPSVAVTSLHVYHQRPVYPMLICVHYKQSLYMCHSEK